MTDTPLEVPAELLEEPGAHRRVDRVAAPPAESDPALVHAEFVLGRTVDDVQLPDITDPLVVVDEAHTFTVADVAAILDAHPAASANAGVTVRSTAWSAAARSALEDLEAARRLVAAIDEGPTPRAIRRYLNRHQRATRAQLADLEAWLHATSNTARVEEADRLYRAAAKVGHAPGYVATHAYGAIVGNA